MLMSLEEGARAPSAAAEVTVGTLAVLAVVGTALAGVVLAVGKATAPVTNAEELEPLLKV